MKNTELLNKISEEVKQLCKMNQIAKVNLLVITVSNTSRVNEENLYRYLKHHNKRMVGPWTKLEIKYDNIQDQIAILQSIE